MINPEASDLNYVIVAGRRSPGRASFSGLSAKYKWDVQRGYGLSGGHVVFRGRELAQFKLRIDVWEPEQFAELGAWLQLLAPPKPGAQPLAVGMQHPLLADVGVEKVVLANRTAITRDGSGLWFVELELLEYAPPKPRLAKPRGAVPATDATAESGRETVETAADRALREERQRNLDAQTRASQ